MKRFSFQLIFLTLISLKVFSQNDFRKGYIITHENDTVFGLINYRENLSVFKTCVFKSQKGQQSVSYEPEQITGYGFVDDVYFESRLLKISDQPERSVFFEVIIKGKVSLYRYEHGFWISKDGTELIQLVNNKEEQVVEGKRVYKYDNFHIATLNMYLMECAQLRMRVQNTKLEEKYLSKLIEDYNSCVGEKAIVYKIKKPWTKVHIGISSGLSFFQQISNDYSTGSFTYTSEFHVANSPSIGLSLDILSPRISERISFHGDVLFLRSRYSSYSLQESGSFATRNYISIELQQLKIPVGVRYTFPDKKFTPFINFGISSTTQLSANSSWIQEVEANNVVEITEKPPLEINRNQLGYWGGIGVHKSISTKLIMFSEIRYEKINGISGTEVSPFLGDLSSTIANLQILIGIKFK